MNGADKVSIVLGSYNRLGLLKLTIESVRAEMESLPHEIIVVDGGSTDGTTRWLAAQKDVITIVQHNRGRWRGREVERRSWGYFMNLGFRCAQGRYVCMLSDDCLVVPGAIRNGYELFERELAAGRRVGAVAFYFRNWPEEPEYGVSLTLGDRLMVNHGMYLREALDEVGYIDEEYHFYHADGDLCLKLWQAGYECIDSPGSYIEHYRHADPGTRRSNLARQQEDWRRYLAKWEGVFYDAEKDNAGRWLRRPFDDPHGTWRKFRSPALQARRALTGMARRLGL